MAHRVMEQIETHFFYLFDQYGFRVFSSTIWHESFGNFAVVLLSDDFRISLLHDRGDVTLSVGPLWSPPSWQAGPWYDLPLVVEFLTHGADKLQDASGTVQQQIVEWAGLLRPYCDRLGPLFQEDSFERSRRELDRLWQEREDRIWDSLHGKARG